MKKLVLVTLLFLLCATLVHAQEPEYDYLVYLPAVMRGYVYVTPTATPPIPTVRPTLPPPTATSTVRPTFPPSTATSTLTPTLTPTITTTPLPTLTSTPTTTPSPTPAPTPQPVFELLNGDFESGQDGSWTEYYDCPPHWLPLVNTFMQRAGFPYLEGHGEWLGWLGGANADPPPWETVTAIEQLITIPRMEGTLQLDVALCFDYLIYSEDRWDSGGDTAQLLLNDTTLVSWEVIGANSSHYWDEWHEMCIDLEDWKGENVTLRFEMVNSFIWYGDFHIDNVELRATPRD